MGTSDLRENAESKARRYLVEGASKSNSWEETAYSPVVSGTRATSTTFAGTGSGAPGLVTPPPMGLDAPTL
jgi:hypothetical protein